MLNVLFTLEEISEDNKLHIKKNIGLLNITYDMKYTSYHRNDAKIVNIIEVLTFIKRGKFYVNKF